MIRIVFFMLLTAVAPSLVLLSFFYTRDRYEAEPLPLVAHVFLMGMLSTLPAIAVKWETVSWPINPFVYTFVISSFIEEAVKFAVTVWIAVRNHEFNEEYDGILYAVSASLGFATVENILKVHYFGLEVATVRAILSVPGHALFGVLMGAYLGKAKFQTNPQKRKLQFLQALLIPWWFHGVYDSILLTGRYWLITLLVPFSVWLVWSSFRQIRLAQNNSPFKPPEFSNQQF